VRLQDDLVEWNVRPPTSGRSAFVVRIHGTTAALRYDEDHAELWLGGQRIASLSGVVRMTTTRDGEFREAVGIAEGPAQVKMRLASGPEIRLHVTPNQRVPLRAGSAR
jgi:hypothetical protein